MKPLNRATSFAEIEKALIASEEALVAAPYFGRGATVSLGLDRIRKLTVICDLFSGACNPYEIRKIMKLQHKPKVLKLEGLHAKIYLTKYEVIVGSANPSANGLSFEGSEVAGNVEACLRIDEPRVVDQWKVFAQNEIVAKASDVTLSDIKRALPIWLRRRNQREAKEKSFLNCLRFAPDALRERRIFVWLYEDTEPNKDHLELLSKEQVVLKDRDLDMYCDWEKIEKEDIIVDFSYSKSSSVYKYGGIWKVFDGRIIKKKKSSIFLVKNEATVGGMSFPANEVRSLKAELLRLFPVCRRPDEALQAFDLSKML